ncbi:hypothetical protein B0H34DRAFT_682904 [Crassisporium funariophilum]|nr:hypothetical protein B0H34DRAFT_682904 [Crassisporium funariophilum]
MEEQSIILLPELYLKVLEFLDYQTLLTCVQVCRSFRDLILGTASLQFTIECAIARQTKGYGTPAVSSASRLETLRKHQSAWENLQWSRELHIPMEDGGLWELCGGVMAQSTPGGMLKFTQLPSDLRAIEEKSWTVGPDLGLHLRDFGMDPSQDLLVLIAAPQGSISSSERQFRVHLRTLSNGKPHPLARDAPVLSLPQVTEEGSVSYTIQISGNFLAVHFCPNTIGENELAIWNWKTGVLQVNVWGNELESFSLLSDELVLLSVLVEADVDIIQPALVVLNFKEEDAERHEFGDISHGTVFHYPEFDEEVYFHSMSIRADPGPSWQPNIGGLQVPFLEDTAQSLFVISIWVQIQNSIQCLVHFVPTTALTLPLATGSGHIKWHEWGPGNTRLLNPPRLHSGTWVCYVYGLKYVVADVNDIQTSGFRIRLYDFNQLAVHPQARSASGVKGTSPFLGKWEVVTTPNVLKAGKPFVYEQDSMLPFRTQVLHLEDAHPHCTVMCSEDNIIVVDFQCREYRVLVF